jgi:hypothetical protein
MKALLLARGAAAHFLMAKLQHKHFQAKRVALAGTVSADTV